MIAEARSSISSTLDKVDEAAEAHGEVGVGYFVERIGHRAIEPLIAMPALLVVSSQAAIPTLPTALALIARAHQRIGRVTSPRAARDIIEIFCLISE